jgi:predicted phage terminase large subunit-like protein
MYLLMIGGVSLERGTPLLRSTGGQQGGGMGDSEPRQAQFDGLATEPKRRRHTLLAWAKRAMEDSHGVKPARHHELLLSHLSLVADGGCDRLLVLMPPGSAKSTYASQVFPAWWFHRHPASSVIAASHTGELASHFGRSVRNLAAEHAEWLGYALKKDNHAAHRFETTGRGMYFAAGLGGAITGRRADLVLIDDPIKSHQEAESAQHRDAAWNWYRSELLPRLKPGGRVVMIMTRWHADDIGGRVLASADGWRVLRLPALAEADDPLGRKPGQPLWPEWEDAAALDRKRVALGEKGWAALYQQRPMEQQSALFRVGRIALLDSPPGDVRWVRAWDLAASEGREADYTVGVKLGRDPAGRFVVGDVTRFKGGPHEVAQTIAAIAKTDGAGVPVSLPQDPGQAGKVQVAWLTSQLAGFRVSASPETGSKLIRAQPVAAQVAAGNLSAIRADWNAAFLAELEEFPQGRRDDQVDALSRAFGGLLEPTTQPPRRTNMRIMAR